MLTLAGTFGIDPDAPFGKLPRKHRELVLFGPSGSARLEKAAAKATEAAPDEDEQDDEEFELPRPRKQSAKSASTFARSESMP